jgi:hypothetical protein
MPARDSEATLFQLIALGHRALAVGDDHAGLASASRTKCCGAVGGPSGCGSFIVRSVPGEKGYVDAVGCGRITVD